MIPLDVGSKTTQFLSLFRSHEVRLRALTLSLIPNWDDAQEILQEASIVMWRKFDTFAPDTNFFAWAATVIEFHCRNFRRRQSREKVRFSDELIQSLVSETVGIADELAERNQFLAECMAKLPADQRQIIRLRYSEGMSVGFIATSLGRSVDAIYHHLSRIRRRLTQCVERAMSKGGVL